MAKSKKKKAGQEIQEQVEAEQVQEQVESQEVGNGEVVPPTIVDAGAEEVFPSQEETQETAKEQAEEKPASKPKVSKRPYIADVEILLSAGTHTKAAMLEFIMGKYPQVSRGGASTFLTDLMNEKYRHWKQRPVTKTPDGKLVFADRIEGPGPEVVPEAEPPEKPAE